MLEQAFYMVPFLGFVVYQKRTIAIIDCVNGRAIDLRCCTQTHHCLRKTYSRRGSHYLASYLSATFCTPDGPQKV